MANSHKRDLTVGRSRAVAVAGPLAFVATVATIAVGVAASDSGSGLMAVDTSQAAGAISASVERDETLSRGSERVAVQEGLTVKPKPTAADKAMWPKRVKAAINGADTELWTTTALNLWTRPDGKAKKVGEIDGSEQVLITGRELGGREEIVVDGESRWVTEGYLAEEKPVAGTGGAAGGTGGTCTNGTSVPASVSGYIKSIHAAVCARWSAIRTYGTLRGGGGDHGTGRAVDIMVSGQTGWDIANYLRANASAFGIKYVIYAQKIWSVERGGEGWRGMSDRGSVTANHYDHVHVSVF